MNNKVKHLSILEYLEKQAKGNISVEEAVKELESRVLSNDALKDTLEDIAEQAEHEGEWSRESRR